MSAGVGCCSAGCGVCSGCLHSYILHFPAGAKLDGFQTMKILTTAEMREVDGLTAERYGVPSVVLMENAGRSVALFVQRRFSELGPRTIFVLCGKGNNGGGGFLVAGPQLLKGATPGGILFCVP